MTQALTTVANYNPGAIDAAAKLWAQATTRFGSPKFATLLHDKHTAVARFFAHTQKHPAQIRPADVKRWVDRLQRTGYKPATVYAMVSRISSFYKWLIEKGVAQVNPANAVRPKAPKPYSSEKTKSLSDKEMNALLKHVDRLGETSLAARRDYAMLFFLFRSGVRINEIMLRWKDMEMTDEGLTFTSRRKGGDIITQEVKSDVLVQAITGYLIESGRMEKMTPTAPLWVDSRPGAKPKPLTSRAFARNLARYGRQIGINMHPHRTRHTFGRIVAEDSGSWTDTQEALGHRDAGTTRVYVSRVGTKRDKMGSAIDRRMK